VIKAADEEQVLLNRRFKKVRVFQVREKTRTFFMPF